MKGFPIAALKEVLKALVEASVDTGVADATSLVTRLDDSAKAWPTNAFTDLIVEITAGTGEGQVRKIASNAATSLVPVTDFATAPDATSQYRIGFYGKMTGDITDRAARLLGVISAGTNLIGKVQEDFGGNVYSKTMTMANDDATRFEADAKKLRDCVILVETHPMLLGETGVEVYTVAASETVGFTKVDISTLYFKNAGAGNNGKISILGVEE